MRNAIAFVILCVSVVCFDARNANGQCALRGCQPATISSRPCSRMFHWNRCCQRPRMRQSCSISRCQPAYSNCVPVIQDTAFANCANQVAYEACVKENPDQQKWCWDTHCVVTTGGSVTVAPVAICANQTAYEACVAQFPNRQKWCWETHCAIPDLTQPQILNNECGCW